MTLQVVLLDTPEVREALRLIALAARHDLAAHAVDDEASAAYDLVADALEAAARS